MVEKAIELGVSRIQLVTTQYSQRRGANMRRLRIIAIESGGSNAAGLEVPEIVEAVALPALLGDWPAQRRLLHCDETGAGQPDGRGVGAIPLATRRQRS